MNSILHKVFVIFVFSFVAAGCATQTTSVAEGLYRAANSDGARLSSEQAIHIAKQAALGRGIELQDFDNPKALYLVSERYGKCWSVLFNGKNKAMVGNYFIIRVNDEKSETEFLGGY